MKTVVRAIVCWVLKKCTRCYASKITVHHERDSPMWGSSFGWYQKGCSNRICQGWIEPLRAHQE